MYKNVCSETEIPKFRPAAGYSSQNHVNIELNTSTPIPGIENITSIIIEPLIAIGNIAAKTVITGSNEFLRACFRITFFSPNPFALAVQT